MLVLSRKQGEQIRIGDTIVITVQRLSGNRVSLGIEAPADCKIMRGELEEVLKTTGGTQVPVRRRIDDSRRVDSLPHSPTAS